MIQSKKRDWVSNMLIPYAVFFAASCAASLLAVIVKLRLFLHKWRSRGQAGSQSRRPSLGGVPISPTLSNQKAVRDLKSRFDERQLERYTYYCYVLTAVVEDIPMGQTAHQTLCRVAEPLQARLAGLDRDHEHQLHCADDR